MGSIRKTVLPVFILIRGENMKLKYIIIAFFCSLAMSYADPFVIHVLLKDDNASTNKNYFGVKTDATDFLDEDSNVGEFELPTLLPPGGLLTGAFQVKKKTEDGTVDVHSYRDYRAVPAFGKGKMNYKLKVAGVTSDFRILFQGEFPKYITKATAKWEIPGLDLVEIDLLQEEIMSIPMNQALLSYVIDIDLEYERKSSVEEADFAIYPNPSKEYIYIASEEIDEVRLSAIDGSAYSKKVENGTIYVGDMPAGSYILSGRDANNKRFAKKIVIM